MFSTNLKINGESTIRSNNENDDASVNGNLNRGGYTWYWIDDKENRYRIWTNGVQTVNADISNGDVTIAGSGQSGDSYMITVKYTDKNNRAQIAVLKNGGTVNVTGNTDKYVVKTTLNDGSQTVNVVMTDVVISSSSSPIEALLQQEATMNLTFTGDNNTLTTTSDIVPVIYKMPNAVVESRLNCGTGKLNITGTVAINQTSTSNTSDAIGGKQKETVSNLIIDEANLTVSKTGTDGNAINESAKITGSSVITVDDNHQLTKNNFDTMSDSLVSTGAGGGKTKYVIGSNNDVIDRLGTLGEGKTLTVLALSGDTLDGVTKDTSVTNSTGKNITVNGTTIAYGATAKVGEKPVPKDYLEVDIANGSIEIYDNDDKTITVTYYDTVGGESVKKTALVSNSGKVTVTQSGSASTANTITTTLDNVTSLNLVLDGVNIKNEEAAKDIISITTATDNSVTLEFSGNNTLDKGTATSGSSISKSGDGSLTIQGTKDGDVVTGKLTITQTKSPDSAIERNAGSLTIQNADITLHRDGVTGNVQPVISTGAVVNVTSIIRVNRADDIQPVKDRSADGVTPTGAQRSDYEIYFGDVVEASVDVDISKGNVTITEDNGKIIVNYVDGNENPQKAKLTNGGTVNVRQSKSDTTSTANTITTTLSNNGSKVNLVLNSVNMDNGTTGSIKSDIADGAELKLKITGNSVITAVPPGFGKGDFDTESDAGKNSILVTTRTDDDKSNKYIFGDETFVKNQLGTLGEGKVLDVWALPDDVLEGITKGTNVTNSTGKEIIVNDTFIPKNGYDYKVGETPTKKASFDVDIANGNIEIFDNADQTIGVTYYDKENGAKKYALVENGGKVNVKQSNSATPTANTITTTLDDGANVNLVLGGVNMANSTESPITVTTTNNSTVTMELDNNNTVISNGTAPAINTTGSSTLKITDENTTSGTLTTDTDSKDSVKKNFDEKKYVVSTENAENGTTTFFFGKLPTGTSTSTSENNPLVIEQLPADVTTLTGIEKGTWVKNGTGNDAIRVNDTFIPKDKTYKVGATPTARKTLDVDLTYGDVEITDIDGKTLAVTYYVKDALNDNEIVKKYALVENDGKVNVTGGTTDNPAAYTVKTTLNNNGSKANVVLKDVIVKSDKSPIEAILVKGSVMNLTLDGSNKLTTSGTNPVIYKHAEGSNNGEGMLNIKSTKDETGKITGSLTAEQTNAGNTSDAIGGDDNGAIVIDDADITVKKNANDKGDALGGNVTVKADSVITVDDKHPIDKAHFVTENDDEILVSVNDGNGNITYIIGNIGFINDNLPTNGGSKNNPIVIEKLHGNETVVTGLSVGDDGKYVKNGTDNEEIIVNDTFVPNNDKTYKVGEIHDPSKPLDVDLIHGNVVIDDSADGIITITYYETDEDGKSVKKIATVNNNGTVNVKQTNSDKETTANTIKTTLTKDGNNVNVVLDGVNMDNSKASPKGSLIDVDSGKGTTVTLALKGESKLTQTDGDKAAIHKTGEGKLIIKDGEDKSSDKTGTLIIEQNDGDAAAIGGEGNETTKNITLDSGFVAVVRGEDAADGGAAIGAAKDGESDNIVINSPASAVLPVTGKDDYGFDIDDGSGVIVTAGNYIIGPEEDIRKVISTDLDPDMTILVLPDGEIDGIPEGMSVTNGTDEDIIVNDVTVAPGETYTIPYKPVSDQSAWKYRVIEGKDSEWTKSSKGVLVFRLNSNALIKVLIDGVEVEFTVDEDGYVTIDAEVLAALDAGKHTIEFVFSDGRCSTHFTVK